MYSYSPYIENYMKFEKRVSLIRLCRSILFDREFRFWFLTTLFFALVTFERDMKREGATDVRNFKVMHLHKMIKR
jgi:hypothetical protein